eukprot:scpid100254/ scgid34741/ 
MRSGFSSSPENENGPRILVAITDISSFLLATFLQAPNFGVGLEDSPVLASLGLSSIGPLDGPLAEALGLEPSMTASAYDISITRFSATQSFHQCESLDQVQGHFLPTAQIRSPETTTLSRSSSRTAVAKLTFD